MWKRFRNNVAISCWMKTFFSFDEPCECILRWQNWSVYEVKSRWVGSLRARWQLSYFNLALPRLFPPAVISRMAQQAAHMCGRKFHRSSTKLFRNCYYSYFIRKHTLRFISLKLIKLKSCNFARLCRALVWCQRRVMENDCRDIKILLETSEGRQSRGERFNRILILIHFERTGICCCCL